SGRGIALFFGIVTPWYVIMAVMFSGFLKDHFINEQLGHLFNNRFPRDSEPVPLGIFWVQHLVLFFPWTLFVLVAFWSWWYPKSNWFEIVVGQLFRPALLKLLMLGPIRQTFPAKFADKIENSFSGPTLRSMWRYHSIQADAAQIP